MRLYRYTPEQQGRSPKYRWWTVIPWRNEYGLGVKVGPITVYRYFGFMGIAVGNRWCWESTYAR